MVRVSIIMATYNCEDTLKKSIDSILAQTYTDWEFVICDDCSTDGTLNILKEYEKQYPEKIIVIQNEVNSKLSFSLNHCLEVAKGAYIARMDGDDISVPERLEKQVRFLDEHPEYAVVSTAMTPFDENGTRPSRYMKPEPTKDDLVSRSPFAHATIMMRREAYDAVGGYTVSKRTTRGQDYDMWFRFFALGLKGYNMQEPLYLVLEDDKALKRRTFKTRCYEVQTKLKGYKLLHYPPQRYIYAFKPILTAVIPVKLIQTYHIKTDAKSKTEEQ